MSNYQLLHVKHLAVQVNDCLLLRLVICCVEAFDPGDSQLWGYVFVFIIHGIVRFGVYFPYGNYRRPHMHRTRISDEGVFQFIDSVRIQADPHKQGARNKANTNHVHGPRRNARAKKKPTKYES